MIRSENWKSDFRKYCKTVKFLQSSNSYSFLPHEQRKEARLGRIMPLAVDLLHPDPETERQRHKLKRLVQHPNSYFMDVKCPGCFKITTVFSHATTVVVCVGCNTVLCTPTGGKARLTEGCSFRKKQH